MVRTAKTDPKALARTAADTTLAKIKGQSGNTKPPTMAEQINSMQKQLADMQFQKQVDDLAAVYEKNVSQSEQVKNGKWNISESETPLTVKTDDIYIGHSVGAKSRNYEVVDKITGEIYSFTEGSKIQNSEVFAGAGVRTPLRPEVSEGLAKEFGGKPSEWQHAKGFGELTQNGEEVRLAEVHWFQAKGIGKVKFKIKRWLDE